MSKNLSQTPKTVAIVAEKITIVRAKKAKNYGEQYNAEDREVSRTKISIWPLLPL